MSAKYQQVADRIRSDILAGSIRPTDRLPTEQALGKTYQVSRGTIRAALAELTSEGLIRSAQGSGSYVASATPMTRYFSLSTFDDDMRSVGRLPSTEVLAAEEITAGLHATRLGLKKSDTVVHIKRLRLADGVPMAVEERVLSPDLCPGLLGEDLVHQSLHWLIAVRYALPLARLEHTVDKSRSTPEVAELLGIAPGDSVLAIERLTFTEDATGTRRPAVWFQSFHREDQPLPGRQTS